MAVGERLVIYGHWGKVIIIERKPGQALDGEGGKKRREIIVSAHAKPPQITGLALDEAKGPIWVATERTIPLPPEAGERLFRHLLAARPEERLPLSTPLVKSTPLAGRVCQLPPYSIVLVAGEGAFGSDTPRVQSNLFPPRPHLTLWYPPYAAAQPPLDPFGLYRVATSQFKEKKFAVITMDLVSLGLEKGGAYTLDLTARSQPDSGLAVKLPDASQRKDVFVPLGANAMPLRFDFTYDRALNDGQIKFVLTRDAIGRGAEFTFEDFRLSKWTPRGQVEK